ncbi:aspartate kinase [SAR11 cluster bacterium PRT-SC02]|nr:aspartate kinase [SAR11 cluster bacterium PRT-SC02]
MAKKVLKFGGTSVGSIERIINAAKIIKREHEDGNSIIVIVSAMAGKTNELIDQSKAISKNFTRRELDVLLTSGEQVSSALLCGALNEIGVKSKSWMNWQIPIITEGENTNSRIININKEKINKFISDGGVAVIPGFQGVSINGDITSIGRGGSDATAVAVAKIFNADSCEIYTDVDGVYSSDPNKIPVAKKIDKISYEEMLELSSLGAKVMQSSAVQTAMIHDIPLEVKSTFTNRKGTKIFGQENIDYNKVITGVAYSKDEAKITLIGVQDKPGVAAEVFEPISKSQINIDMVIQNVSSDGKTTDLTFTIKREELDKTIDTIKNNKKIKFKELSFKKDVSKISIVGAGMVTTPGVTYKMFRALASENINILAISTSEIKISVIINDIDTLRAVKKLHSIFELD